MNNERNDFVYGLVVLLVDNNPYDSIEVDILIDNLYVGSYAVPRLVNIDNDCFGSSTAIFKKEFRPFKTTGKIKIMIKTKLLYNDLITIKLLKGLSYPKERVQT